MDEHLNPSSPAGQVASAGDLAARLTHLSGWRRQAARWLVVAVLALPVVLVVITHV